MDGEEYNKIFNTLMRERRGRSSVCGGGGAHPTPPPLNLEKIKFFAENRDFSHEILQKKKCAPRNLKSWIRPWSVLN